MSSPKRNNNNNVVILLILFFCTLQSSKSFSFSTRSSTSRYIALNTQNNNDETSNKKCTNSNKNRRNFLNTLFTTSTTLSLLTINSKQTNAANFAPGGTLVEYEVGPQVNNPEASPSRKFDNSNVIFTQDYYFKFGTAAQWIPSGSTEFPKTMPFVISQQRYDALKKYGSKIISSCTFLTNDVKNAIADNNLSSIPDPATSTSYSLRSFGLLANNFLASENTGTTNELLLARYYINEVYLHINDIRVASNNDVALVYYNQLVNALNSYLTLMNRVITSKVGDKFDYV